MDIESGTVDGASTCAAEQPRIKSFDALQHGDSWKIHRQHYTFFWNPCQQHASAAGLAV
jgi:hypothetical protein